MASRGNFEQNVCPGSVTAKFLKPLSPVNN